jgi:phage shock protein B
MHAITLAVIFGFALLALTIIACTILMAMRILKGGFSKRDQEFQAEEAKMIQEMYQGFSRMEERVEALETIILDREGKDPAR